MAKFGRWLRRSLKVVSPSAIRIVLQESNTSLTALKEVAKTNAVVKESEATDKKLKADKLSVESKALFTASKDINDALAELDSADGKI